MLQCDTVLLSVVFENGDRLAIVVKGDVSSRCTVRTALFIKMKIVNRVHSRIVATVGVADGELELSKLAELLECIRGQQSSRLFVDDGQQVLLDSDRIHVTPAVWIASVQKADHHLVEWLFAHPEASVGNIDVVTKADTTLSKVLAHTNRDIRALVYLNNTTVAEGLSGFRQAVEVALDGEHVLRGPLTDQVVTEVECLLNLSIETGLVLQIASKGIDPDLGRFSYGHLKYVIVTTLGSVAGGSVGIKID